MTALGRYRNPKDFSKLAQPIAQASLHADALFIPDGGNAMDVKKANLELPNNEFMIVASTR